MIMSYIQVGATDRLTGNWIPTKKALKTALSQDPGSVVFDATSPFAPWHGSVDMLTEGTTLSVIGPDPYNRRVWYASIKIVEGKVTFS